MRCCWPAQVFVLDSKIIDQLWLQAVPSMAFQLSYTAELLTGQLLLQFRETIFAAAVEFTSRLRTDPRFVSGHRFQRCLKGRLINAPLGLRFCISSSCAASWRWYS